MHLKWLSSSALSYVILVSTRSLLSSVLLLTGIRNSNRQCLFRGSLTLLQPRAHIAPMRQVRCSPISSPRVATILFSLNGEAALFIAYALHRTKLPPSVCGPHPPSMTQGAFSHRTGIIGPSSLRIRIHVGQQGHLRRCMFDPILSRMPSIAQNYPPRFVALILLQRLKVHFPIARGSSGHRLFVSAFMLASKVICDDACSNKFTHF